jgi:hypothetical protein
MDKNLPCRATFLMEGAFIDSSINIFDSLKTPVGSGTN